MPVPTQCCSFLMAGGLPSIPCSPVHWVNHIRAVHAALRLAVGLDSGIRVEDFKRKRLNLILLLDVSGSMSSPFDLYY